MLVSSVIMNSRCYSDIRNYYDLQKVIGHGHFGTVREAVKKADPSVKVAVKSIPKEKIVRDIAAFRRELDLLHMLDHPNIIKFFETYEDAHTVHIVTERCSGGDLFDYVISQGQCSEAITARIMRKALSAVNYMHRIKVCHRDLKPENFLFETKAEDSEVKIIDFGLAFKFGSEEATMHTVVGTPYYVAPEVLRGDYGAMCDIWSLGVMMYVLLSGFPPFQGECQAEVFDKIMKCQYSFDFPEFDEVSGLAKDLIAKMLALSPNSRPMPQELLEHPWFHRHSDNSALSRRAIASLKRYKARSKLQQETMKIFLRFLSNDDLSELRVTATQASFQAIDIDHTGFITASGLERALHHSGLNLAEEELKSEEYVELRATFDYLDEGKLNYTAFLIATLDKRKMLDEERIYGTFLHFDAGKTGLITVETLAQALIHAGLEVTQEEVEQMLADFSFNHDRKITYEEFKAMLTSSLESASPLKSAHPSHLLVNRT